MCQRSLDEIPTTPFATSLSNDSATVSSILLGRRPGLARQQERAGHGVLRGHHGQRFECWNHGFTFRHSPAGGQHGGGRRHRLHPRRDLQHHEAEHQWRRHHLFEERDLGHQPNQVLGLPRRSPRLRLLEDDHLDHRLYPRVRDQRELVALQGARRSATSP